jgi:sugar phosphate isomerase/epimerase
MAQKKLSIGSWAYTFGPYGNNPIPFDTVVKTLGKLGFDGVEVGGFRPHIYPDDYPMKADREKVVGLLKDAKLGVSGLAADFWGLSDPCCKCPPGNPENEQRYISIFKKNLQLCLDLGAPAIRVDTGEGPDAYKGPKRAAVMRQIAKVWKQCAAIGADFGVRVTWEFEPGFLFNKPSEIVALADKVSHPNFGIMLDTCHAYMCAVVGARQPGKKETLKGGVVELARMLSGKINHVHLIDSDGTLHGGETSTHRPFGEGLLNFSEIIPAIEKAGYAGQWWTIDLCNWPEAWDVTANAKDFLKPYLK